MILNILLLIITILILYFGYIYTGIIYFFTSLIYDDVKIWFKKITNSKGSYDVNTKTWKVIFFIKDKEYNIIIPENQINLEYHNFLAMSNSINKTSYIKKIIGPLLNFWGFSVTPKQLGLNSPLTIWTKGFQYVFPLEENIIFNDDYIVIDSDSSEDSGNEDM